MATREEHCADCKRLLGDPCEEVNKWMDALFHYHGPRHRGKRHHWEGVEEAEKHFGIKGREAAIVHIMKDCGHIPKRADYLMKNVDWLGMNGNFNGYWDAKAFTAAVEVVLELDRKNRTGV